MNRTAAALALAACAATAAACTPAADPAAGTHRLAQAALPHPITVEDDTAGAYNVALAVANWHVPGATLGTCRVTVGWCVKVLTVATLGAGALPGTETLGETWQTPAFRLTTVALADDAPAVDRPQTVCHELGHAFGLDHDTTGGCMYANTSGAFPLPSPADLAAITKMYR